MAIPLFVQALLMTTLPHGGQRTARRNAWAATSACSARARARREAEQAVLDACSRGGQRVRTGS